MMRTEAGTRSACESDTRFSLRHSPHPAKPWNTAGHIESVLVTGGTGFIGGATLAELFQGPLWPRTLIMVRAASLAEGRRRIVQSLQRFLPDSAIEAHLRYDQILLCGLEECERLHDDARLRNVTHVIHSAAVTAFSNHPRIRAINVDASLQFVDVLRQCAKVERFINVGTAWCVGMDVGSIVLEDGEQGSDKHVVPYTQSKLEFEHTLRRQHPDFPMVSARPSIVVGHTTLGTSPSGSIYWVFRSAQILGQSTCSFDERIDIVPVDWVAKSLIQLLTKKELWFDTYHLSAGEQSHSTFAQIEHAIAAGRNVPPHGHANFKRVSSRELTKCVYENRAKLGNPNPLILARALDLYSNFAESGVLFDNSRTLSEDIAPPPPFRTYADACAQTAEGSSISAQMEDDFK